MMDELVYVVCARRAADTDAWRREHGLPRRRVIHAGSVLRTEGLRNFQAVYLPGFDERRDADAIRESLRRGELKMAAGRGLAGA
ncbi:hypothetical protein [Streptomyces hirsutus]|uniref:hypothetical protein n=1 Tax=Streptomyces hirsutus TaxID=35620 RepID=UPI0036CBD3F5